MTATPWRGRDGDHIITSSRELNPPRRPYYGQPSPDEERRAHDAHVEGGDLAQIARRIYDRRT